MNAAHRVPPPKPPKPLAPMQIPPPDAAMKPRLTPQQAARQLRYISRRLDELARDVLASELSTADRYGVESLVRSARPSIRLEPEGREVRIPRAHVEKRWLSEHYYDHESHRELMCRTCGHVLNRTEEGWVGRHDELCPTGSASLNSPTR